MEQTQSKRIIKFREFLESNEFHYRGFIDDMFISPVSPWSPQMQFTGICDVHNKDIYEGDLMEMFNNKYVQDRGEVRLIGGTWRACFEHHKFALSMSQTKCFRLKVVGNIHLGLNL
jgi:hypothetical protein